ncbi:MAG: hypothetical protein SCI25_00265 [Desulfuromonadales bacterium]|nr:hypothetical protein [Desulfuromonadales bacterium]
MNTLDTIELPGLIWADEFDWSGVVSEAAPAINGSVVVQEAALSGGRPVTLQGDATRGWLKRSSLVALQSLAGAPGASYVLTWGGTQYTVRFRHEDGPVIAGSPVIDYDTAGETDDYHSITLKLITV